MNEDDPVDAMIKSKKMHKLDEKKLRELFINIENIKNAKFEDIFTKGKEHRVLYGNNYNKMIVNDDEFIKIAKNEA
jgi:hypothetical protein